MGKINAFNFLTLNGYYKGLNGDISWHKHGQEENEYAQESLNSGVSSTLLFGRVTYEMMAGFWPTPAALERDPIVAAGMNNSEKIVVSRTLKKATWQNTKLIRDNMIDEIKAMKSMPDKYLTILGSGSLVAQLSEHGLIDEYQIMIDPVAIGKGTPLFTDMKGQLNLKLTKTKVFKSGVVLLCYEPGK